MKLLNRSAFTVVPKQPFVDWANGLELDDEGLNQALTLEEHQREGTVYLIDEVEADSDFEAALTLSWATIFENELAAWDEMADAWPEPRSQMLFADWFEVKPQVMALDLASEPMMVASLEE